MEWICVGMEGVAFRGVWGKLTDDTLHAMAFWPYIVNKSIRDLRRWLLILV